MRKLAPFFLILIISGCDIYRSGEYAPRVILQPGMEFTYESSFFETDSTFTDTLGYFAKDIVIITVLKSDTTIAGHENLIQLRVTPEGSDGSLEETQDTWYIQNRESLTEIAYRNPGITRVVVPKMAGEEYSRQLYSPSSGLLESRTLNFIMNQNRTTQYTGGPIPADSIQIREDPRIVLQYPLKENDEWTSITYPFTINRKVMEMTENDATSQSDWTASIQSWYDPDEIQTIYFDWVDRFNQHGMISRVIKSTHKRMDEHGYENGLFHIMETVDLIEISYSGGD